jgi:hypothetical protein
MDSRVRRIFSISKEDIQKAEQELEAAASRIFLT